MLRRANRSNGNSPLPLQEESPTSTWRNKKRQGLWRKQRLVMLALAASFVISMLILYYSIRMLPIQSVPTWKRTNLDGSATVALQQLRPVDYQGFTIRINTWKRPELLRISIDHHLSCPSVASIQVVWCEEQGPPPAWLYDEERVQLELHKENSLNERFYILENPPTLGILSLDDDVLRPCQAYDAAWRIWLQNPDRLVGFDARSHDTTSEHWKYVYQSVTAKSNRYSLTLTRCCFVHFDYLGYYMSPALAPIRQTIQENRNCEDIAVSLLVSSFTDGNPPLLADYWVFWSLIKLRDSGDTISTGSDHKKLRDGCVDSFSRMLGVRDLRYSELSHETPFEYGQEPSNWNALPNDASKELSKVTSLMKHWKENPKLLSSELLDVKIRIAEVPYKAELLDAGKLMDAMKTLDI